MRPITVRFIAETVAEYHGIRYRDLISARRTAELITPRHVTAWLARELTPHTLPAIGRCLHRDHTTMLYAIHAVEGRMAADEGFREEVHTLRRAVEVGWLALAHLGAENLAADVDVAAVADKVLSGRAVDLPVAELRALAATALTVALPPEPEPPPPDIAARLAIAAAAERYVAALDRRRAPGRAAVAEIAVDSTLYELRAAIRRAEATPITEQENAHAHA